MKYNPTLIVDRTSFMAWINGTLLERNKKGECIVGDLLINEEAEKAAQNGEVVGLTSRGRLVSVLISEEDGIVEKQIE